MVSFLFLAFLVLRCTAKLGIPSSQATVDVRAFNVANFSVTLPGIFAQPVLPAYETIRLPLHAFLVEHTANKKRFMFDLGIRTDLLNFPPSVSSVIQSGSVEPFRGITELLEDGGIPLDSIETVIWRLVMRRKSWLFIYIFFSHSHFDHIGDMSKFPNTTSLVVGPGTNRSLYPEFPDGALQASDFAYVLCPFRPTS
jgi:hypothetical protein